MTSSALAERFRAARRDPALAVLEGLHPLKHALRFGAEPLEVVSPDPEALLRLVAELAPDLRERVRALVRPVSAGEFAGLAPSAPSSPVIALAPRPALDLGDALARAPAAPVVVLEDPTHAGNIGAVVRVAAAAGAAAVLCLGGQDPWRPAALRGGAGLQFALPVLRLEALPAGEPPGTDALALAGHPLDALPAQGRALVALHPDGEPLRAGVLPPGALLAFGSERRGLSAALLERAAVRVSIPMRAGVSSLNLATAVAIALYVDRL